MAGSRVFKIGNIFTRMTALLESGVLSPCDKPAWYDVYKRFPPLYDPYFDRPAPVRLVKNIVYEEDFIRAKIHQTTSVGFFDLNEHYTTSQTKTLIKKCEEIMRTQHVSQDEALKLLSNTKDQKKVNE